MCDHKPTWHDDFYRCAKCFKVFMKKSPFGMEKIPITYEEEGMVKLHGITLSKKERILVEKINEIIDRFDR